MSLLASIASPADLRKLPMEKLPLLAQEIREAICEQVKKSGGHLAPNLGVVELTIALHYVFDFAHDRLLFDVGHQCYTHKLLTGRQHLLANLRTREGMAGFPEPRESAYDLFSVGHAGTGISTAVGMARGDSLNGEGPDNKSSAGRRTAVVIGDASIANGLAMEGLNAAGLLKRQFLVVLNDNGMSISKPQGAVSHYFDRLRISQTYTDFKKRAREALTSMPGGGLIRETYHWWSEAAKKSTHSTDIQSGWFEGFGLKTVGPIDGHDFPTLIAFLREARDFDRPLVLHVKTIKGKGYAFAEKDASKFHSPAPFKIDPDTLDDEGCRVEIKSEGRSFTSAFGDALTDLMARDPKVLACTAAMPDGTGVSKAIARFPDRSFDSGICESHAMDMMAGLAKTGFKPFFAVYSTFLQRAFDQAFQEIALQGLPVRLCLDRAGLVGGDGAVHHGFCDLAILRTLPGAVLTAAADEPSLKAALEFMRTHDAGLSAVRYPRDSVSEMLLTDPCPSFELGKARCLSKGYEWLSDLEGHAAEKRNALPDLAVLGLGTSAIDALKAAAMVGEDLKVAVWDARFAKPVDEELVTSLLSRKIHVVTVEDHSVVGGFGSAVLEAAQAHGLDASRVTRLGLPDRWIYQDSRAKQMAEVGLDPASLAKRFREIAAGGPVVSSVTV
jgi:1-deoxy-D-xylulose-5-phosphate synthase